jgi:hypothetical protein
VRHPVLVVSILLLCGAFAPAPPGRAAPPAAPAAPDTLRFAPTPRADQTGADEGVTHFGHAEPWLRTPIGDRLLTDPDEWRSEGRRTSRFDATFDYNRVDPLRLGLGAEFQRPGTRFARLGGRLEYATERDRMLYGLQIEQPLAASGRYAVGAVIARVTAHYDLQQVEDFENSLAMLFARTDYRDYFEREGGGAYLAWRVPDFATVSVHLRNDEFRSIPLYAGTRSWFYRDRDLRPNPPIEPGAARSVLLRLERLAHRTRQMRAGLYHGIELEWAGGRLGGDFDYTRMLADVRGVWRLSPEAALVVRTVAGHASSGALPLQKQFVTGGVDGLRAHATSSLRGDQMALGQAEAVIGLWHLRTRGVEGGLHAIAFIDAGQAWFEPGHTWDPGRQHFETDAGVGLGTSEDNLRVYAAKNLRDPASDVVWSVRLQRPF